MKKQKVEVSIVMPCLNEQETLGACIEKAQRTLKSLSITTRVQVSRNLTLLQMQRGTSVSC